MSSKDLAVSVRGLAKSYTISHNAQQFTTIREALIHRIQKPLERNEKETFWALKNIDFDVRKGEVVGIIGRNGAGKSTLLKLLSQITEPTKGEIKLYGRVGSLLEVGTGFHPELTGRENIFLNGAILGMRKAEIERQFDAIVDFAEVEKFIDTPVKRYSSGMYVRLAFAVAAHLNPDILIVDEVLAVGDAQFQKKCLGKMQDVAGQGRTILFVSHNLEVVRKLCSSGVFLQNGEVMMIGATKNVLDEYVNSGDTAKSTYTIDQFPDDDVPGYAYKLTVEDVNGDPTAEIPVGCAWQVRISFKVLRKTEDFVCGLGMMTALNFPLRTSWSSPETLEPGDYEAVFREPNIFIEPGQYRLMVGLSIGGRHTFHYAENAGVLQIAPFSNFSENHNLVSVSDCGVILNPMENYITRLPSAR